MNCPRCGAEYTELEKAELVSEGTNQHGRKELILKATHRNWVEWKNGKYHCKKCGLTFSFKEGVMEKLGV